MSNNIQPSGDLMQAVATIEATIEANGASVFCSPVGGQYIVVLPGTGRRDGFTAAAIIRMAQDLKPGEQPNGRK